MNTTTTTTTTEETATMPYTHEHATIGRAATARLVAPWEESDRWTVEVTADGTHTVTAYATGAEAAQAYVWALEDREEGISVCTITPEEHEAIAAATGASVHVGESVYYMPIDPEQPARDLEEARRCANYAAMQRKSAENRANITTADKAAHHANWTRTAANSATAAAWEASDWAEMIADHPHATPEQIEQARAYAEAAHEDARRARATIEPARIYANELRNTEAAEQHAARAEAHEENAHHEAHRAKEATEEAKDAETAARARIWAEIARSGDHGARYALNAAQAEAIAAGHRARPYGDATDPLIARANSAVERANAAAYRTITHALNATKNADTAEHAAELHRWTEQCASAALANTDTTERH